VADMLMWSAMFSMMMPPHFVVVDHHNQAQGFVDDPGIQDGPTSAESPGADDGGSWWDGDANRQAVTDGGDLGGSSTDGDGGGSWWGGDSGGDSGGGFDGGGGDFGGGGDW